MNAATFKDIEISDPPTDSISSMTFSKRSDLLAVGSWDNSVRIYEVNHGISVGKAMYNQTGPVLSVIWNVDDTQVFSAGADNKGCMLDVVTGQVTQIAQHEAPIRVIRWVEVPGAQSGVLATASWDKTLRYWDLRAPRPAATVTLTERCYAMDTHGQLLTVGTADRQVQVFNINNPMIPYKVVTSPLKMQTRTISCFATAVSPGFAIGSVEGRVAIHYIEDKDRDKNYSFRCHRGDTVPGKKDQAKVYAVNEVNFHPVHGSTFSTRGSDGVVNYWDKDARSRLKSGWPPFAQFAFEAAQGSITTSAFNRNGSLFAYAVSYDWSQGHQGMTSGYPNKLMLHKVEGAEVQPRSRRV